MAERYNYYENVKDDIRYALGMTLKLMKTT